VIVSGIETLLGVDQVNALVHPSGSVSPLDMEITLYSPVITEEGGDPSLGGATYTNLTWSNAPLMSGLNIPAGFTYVVATHHVLSFFVGPQYLNHVDGDPWVFAPISTASGFTNPSSPQIHGVNWGVSSIDTYGAVRFSTLNPDQFSSIFEEIYRQTSFAISNGGEDSGDTVGMVMESRSSWEVIAPGVSPSINAIVGGVHNTGGVYSVVITVGSHIDPLFTHQVYISTRSPSYLLFIRNVRLTAEAGLILFKPLVTDAWDDVSLEAVGLEYDSLNHVLLPRDFGPIPPVPDPVPNASDFSTGMASSSR